MDNSQDKHIARLRQAIVAKLGREMRTSGDYTYLSECIFEEQHQTVSPTTLKRLWGYLSEPVTPRVSTLDILACFVGYESYEDFCQRESDGNDAYRTAPPPAGLLLVSCWQSLLFW